MLRLLADENFNNAILRGLRLRNPDLDIVRIQDIGLSREEDLLVLDWADAGETPALPAGRALVGGGAPR